MNKGFTMIEMVIVILLIGIMSMLAVPRFETGLYPTKDSAQQLGWVGLLSEN